MDKKGFWRSKTLWVNLIAGIALVVQSQYGFVLDAEAQGAILAVINLLLRFVTREPLGLRSESSPPALIDAGPPEALQPPGPGA